MEAVFSGTTTRIRTSESLRKKEIAAVQYPYDNYPSTWCWKHTQLLAQTTLTSTYPKASIEPSPTDYRIVLSEGPSGNFWGNFRKTIRHRALRRLDYNGFVSDSATTAQAPVHDDQHHRGQYLAYGRLLHCFYPCCPMSWRWIWSLGAFMLVVEGRN